MKAQEKRDRKERELRLKEAIAQGIQTVYLCKNHDWYVGRSEQSKQLHYMITQCEALPSNPKEFLPK